MDFKSAASASSAIPARNVLSYLVASDGAGKPVSASTVPEIVSVPTEPAQRAWKARLLDEQRFGRAVHHRELLTCVRGRAQHLLVHDCAVENVRAVMLLPCRRRGCRLCRGG